MNSKCTVCGEPVAAFHDYCPEHIDFLSSEQVPVRSNAVLEVADGTREKSPEDEARLNKDDRADSKEQVNIRHIRRLMADNTFTAVLFVGCSPDQLQEIKTMICNKFDEDCRGLLSTLELDREACHEASVASASSNDPS